MKRLTKPLVLVAAVLGTVAFAAAGWAYWTTLGSGSGAASATVGTLNAPTHVSATQPDPGISTVNLSWTASVATAPAVTPDGYFVQRDGTTDVCGTVAAPLPSSSASCEDTNVSSGNHTYTVTAEFATGSWTAVSDSSSVTVRRTPSITSAASATFTVGSAGSFTVTVTGYPAPSLSETGTLPAGVTFTAATGVLSGTPAPGTGGTYPITFIAANGVGSNATQSFTLTVNESPVITSGSSAAFTVGGAGLFTVTATGSPAPTFSRTAGTLPSSVTLSSAGVLSGTPTAGTSGTYPITITASNGIGTAATQSFTLTVNVAPSVSTTTLASATKGQTGYSQTLASTGGTGTITWSVQSGLLPTGLGLNSSTGVISGNLSGTATSQTFTVAATDTNSVAGTKSLTITVNAAPTVTTTSLASATKGQTGYSQTLASTGGTGTTTWSVQSGLLPTGLGLNSSTGVISGNVDTAATTQTFTVAATDTNSADS
jgi:hypothetical protein